MFLSSVKGQAGEEQAQSRGGGRFSEEELHLGGPCTLLLRHFLSEGWNGGAAGLYFRFLSRPPSRAKPGLPLSASLAHAGRVSPAGRGPGSSRVLPGSSDLLHADRKAAAPTGAGAWRWPYPLASSRAQLCPSSEFRVTSLLAGARRFPEGPVLPFAPGPRPARTLGCLSCPQS